MVENIIAVVVLVIGFIILIKYLRRDQMRNDNSNDWFDDYDELSDLSDGSEEKGV
jgi:hypothetical protein